MTVSITTEPAYLIPGKEAQVTATATTGNWVEVILTDAPEASSWKKRLVNEDRAEIQLWAAESGEKRAFTFDVAGRYVCTLREITRGGVTFGGGYSNDPDGYPSETVEGTTNYSFVIGQKLTAPLAIGSESGTISLYVWNQTIRSTTVPSHGEQTPRLDGDTEKMKIAASSSGVVAALASLAGSSGVSASTAVSSFSTIGNDIIAKFNSHITSTSAHSAADSDNSITSVYGGAGASGLTETLRQMATKVRQHYTNDAGTGYGVGSASYHSAGDWDNLPAVSGASNTLTTGLALASIWQSFESHRIDTSVHVAADTTNTCADLPPLLDVYKEVIAVVTADNPTAPNTDNPGAVLMVNRAGLVKA